MENHCRHSGMISHKNRSQLRSSWGSQARTSVSVSRSVSRQQKVFHLVVMQGRRRACRLLIGGLGLIPTHRAQTHHTNLSLSQSQSLSLSLSPRKRRKRRARRRKRRNGSRYAHKQPHHQCDRTFLRDCVCEYSYGGAALIPQSSMVSGS